MRHRRSAIQSADAPRHLTSCQQYLGGSRDRKHKPGQALCHEDTTRQSCEAGQCSRCEGALCGDELGRQVHPVAVRDHK